MIETSGTSTIKWQDLTNDEKIEALDRYGDKWECTFLPDGKKMNLIELFLEPMSLHNTLWTIRR